MTLRQRLAKVSRRIEKRNAENAQIVIQLNKARSRVAALGAKRDAGIEKIHALFDEYDRVERMIFRAHKRKRWTK